MGTDIHGPFVEQQRINGEWEEVANFRMLRNYAIFSLMAGVRGDSPKSFNPKGMPKDASWYVLNHFLLRVRDEVNPDEDDECTQERAQHWVSSGSSQVWEEKNGVPVRITNPDWHTPSWLGTEEVKKLIRLCRSEGIQECEAFRTIKAIYALMKALDEPDRPCRILFWFDC